MITSQDKKELIKDIKNPIRYYRIRLWGYGGEIVYGNSTAEEYDYWVTNAEARKKEFSIEDSNPFEEYMLNKDVDEKFKQVPPQFVREYDWYEHDSVEHCTGVTSNSAIIEIVELENKEYGADEIETIVDAQQFFDEFLDEWGCDYIVSDSDAFDQQYVFYAMSVEKGTFIECIVETDGKIDLTKLQFNGTDFPNGDELIVDIEYDGDLLDNDGVDTNGKGLYIELVEL
jgi:hypothetical protein